MKHGFFSRLKLSKLRVRLFASFMAILIVCFTVIFIAAGPALTTFLVYKTAGDLNDVSERIDALAPGSPTYYFELYYLAVNNNISFELIGADGSLAYQSAAGYSAQSSGHLLSANSTETEYSQTKNVVTYDIGSVDGLYEKRRKIATKAEYLVFSKDMASGETLHIFSPVAVIDSNVAVAVRAFSFICIIICLIMLIIVYTYVLKFTKPLVEMNDVTRDMAALNFARRCKHYGSDEIGELSGSINALSTALDSALMDLREKNERLERDIEHRVELDSMRRDFINNVSHELKTPIAIISGYAEGLCAGISDEPEVIREYCEIILEESKKMNGLVVELLELSALESQKVEIVPTSYSLTEQINEVLSHFSILFSNHSIEVAADLPENADCVAQKDKIEIVLKNYISNAVSHCTVPGRISVRCEDMDDKWKVTVFNTGDGIKDEDINNIWTSFYRADKAHARSENRFGLGLSIVQAIMKNHSMGYGAENVRGGVEFWFEVKKDR